LELILGKL
jgi:hypothetical protein